MKYLKWSLLLLVLTLTGCKVDLYRDLPQDEANQMVALLMLNHIDASAESDQKTANVTLTIEKDQFINAVELLRQNGFPKPHYANIEDLFPSGQLVTSPAQEEAKMGYLKEQQLERTLSSMDGVISARVSIAEPAPDTGRQVAQTKSSSVYIKYSPQANLTNTENQIKRLVQNAVPGLSYDNISVFLQAASYRYQPVSQPSGDVSQVSRQLAQYKLPLVVGLSGIMLLSLGGMWWMRRKSC